MPLPSWRSVAAVLALSAATVAMYSAVAHTRAQRAAWTASDTLPWPHVDAWQRTLDSVREDTTDAQAWLLCGTWTLAAGVVVAWLEYRAAPVRAAAVRMRWGPHTTWRTMWRWAYANPPEAHRILAVLLAGGALVACYAAHMSANSQAAVWARMHATSWDDDTVWMVMLTELRDDTARTLVLASVALWAVIPAAMLASAHVSRQVGAIQAPAVIQRTVNRSRAA
jgi:hypothetical protein